MGIVEVSWKNPFVQSYILNPSSFICCMGFGDHILYKICCVN
ncbi:MAG: hypothetical protein Harvfovirus6_5 [Harvfovirus sp.]|uniref:Uncharacterized protein n=1 Tax=Harvfovirus sp. TaxID=2487768 RepID=A0A3G5A0N8_9VIRU|nr:MAG: hypothetical protein Harvfovirus6_5 [Harvfovirus sp.]